ncbi:paraquat-inducible protein A [Sinimarinibacterium sp. CAU 1509]|uniref:paraquat-inducible protein A n=1 Tax=Sinimarinibacterium sp. CAU 1509 TaxID=2562283 RepID=UPI0010AD17E9|nr:paraquat-inducible protein A [Sinimarinibacterium sp. CAU 1509]TJY61910.1 paraquat-inducible protein A [Sinimarinibacterium sp. CAU 1509]
MAVQTGDDSKPELVICEHCDSVYQRSPLPAGAVARCLQCGAELYRNRRVDLDTMLALTVTSMIVMAIANAYPVVWMDLGGQSRSVTLWGAVLSSYDAGVGLVAVVSAACIFLMPLLQIAVLIYVLVPLRAGRVPQYFASAMHALRRMQPWSMVEVFLLGILVSAVKLAADAAISPGIGLWGFALLTYLLTLITSYDLHELWDLAAEEQS